jgi:peptide subunit release factor 1 (eRF1)
MLARRDIQSLIQRQPGEHPVLSLYLDMSVGADNKRNYQLFLNKQRAAAGELLAEGARPSRAALDGAFERIQRWIDTEYDERHKGVAIFCEPDGDYFEAHQFPRAVSNRFELQDRPAIAPLAQVLEPERHWAVAIVDREHLHLLSIFFDQVEEEQTFTPDAIPTRHAVQAGGYSQKDYQKRKAEETRHFFKDFADEAGKLMQRRNSDGLVLLGTAENTSHFQEFLPQQLRERVVHVAPAPAGLTSAELAQHLAPALRGVLEEDENRAVQALLERVRQSHFATAGVADTLRELQEGKVDRLLIARAAEHEGAQCTQCGFYLAARDGACPYCGGTLREGVDLVESMLRMAAKQEARVSFVADAPLEEVRGVGALLRF